MKFDQELIFSDGQSIAQIAGSYVSTNSIDASPPAGTPAIGGPLQSDYGRIDTDLDIVIIVTTALASAGAATIVFQVIQADDGPLTTNVQVLRESRALACGNQPSIVVKGSIFRLGPVPSMTKRYLGLQYTIAVATTTTGIVTAGLAYGVPSNAANLLG